MIWKGDAAGRGPSSPEPPNMITETSGDCPSTVDDLDAGDGEVARTKMAFAKMQTPYELRDSYGFDDRDFEVHEEETQPDEGDEASEENYYEEDADEEPDTMSSTINSERGGKESRRASREAQPVNRDDDSFNPASVYDNDESAEVIAKPKSKKKKKTSSKVSKGADSESIGEVAAELGLY